MDNGGSNATIVKTNASTTTGRSTDSINVDLILASNLLVSNTVGGNGFALNLSGTITETNGALSYDLTLSGQVLGDGTFDMAVHADSSGLVASAVVSDLEIGGIVLESASIQISTVDSTADLQASMQTRGGNFDAELQVSG
jgi:hypothetical protein